MYIEDGFTLNLAAARCNANLSRPEVAEAVGVSDQTISNWEHFKSTPNAKHLVALSELYKVPIAMIRLTP